MDNSHNRCANVCSSTILTCWIIVHRPTVVHLDFVASLMAVHISVIAVDYGVLTASMIQRLLTSTITTNILARFSANHVIRVRHAINNVDHSHTTVIQLVSRVGNRVCAVRDHVAILHRFTSTTDVWQLRIATIHVRPINSAKAGKYGHHKRAR